MSKIESSGYHLGKNNKVATFRIQGVKDSVDERENTFVNTYQKLLNADRLTVSLQGYRIPVWGTRHNLYPQEVDALIRENKILPSLLQKRVQFLYGKGPVLYVSEVRDGEMHRRKIYDSDILDWLNSWEEYGLPSWHDYVFALTSDYYRTNTCVSQYHVTKGGDVYGLEYVGSDRARLAMSESDAAQIDRTRRQIRNRDCGFVIVGDWLAPSSTAMEVYHRYCGSGLVGEGSIAFNAQPTFGRGVYAYNDWYEGLREWVKASNLTPKYLNGYLRNALNAHVHCEIPEAWYQSQKEILQNLCQQNIIEGDPKKRAPEYRGVALLDNGLTPYTYSEQMMQDLISNELERVTEMLSGDGDNQGKLYATLRVGGEGWQFHDFPQKFKEYFDSVISYDRRADQVTLAGLGISSSITNVEQDGQISKSGSDVYYNYVVYMSTLRYHEEFILRELNRAIQMRFPDTDVRVGFDIEIPLRQQEISPKDRL